GPSKPVLFPVAGHWRHSSCQYTLPLPAPPPLLAFSKGRPAREGLKNGPVNPSVFFKAAAKKDSLFGFTKLISNLFSHELTR
ncbi:hypothetical protein, partial [Saccharicrinis sp. 156]|uniref:hypothetical protein n=1 Tax=Saccharicrinis sp. 156 TaxID=3417574 RepID=UPI003D326C01